MGVADRNFEALFSASGLISVFVWHNRPGWPVEYVTENVKRMLGITKEDFERHVISYDHIVHPDDYERMNQEVKQAITDPNLPASFTHEDYRLVHSNGGVIWVTDTTIIERDESGDVRYLFGYIIDITVQKEAELEARRAAQAKNLFLANISHEIRTPLHGILGITEVLERTKLDTQQRELLNTIKRSGDYLLRTLNDVLDLTGAEEGKLRLVVKAEDPRLIFNHLVALFQESCRRRGIDFSIDLDSALPPLLKLDHARLLQVLSNLVNNAEKFTERGSIQVSVRWHAPILECTVSDTGIGIFDTDRIWQSFEQEEASVTKRRAGSGLGLAIVRNIVQLMGGEINVTSRIGQGTEFRLKLPSEALYEGSLEDLCLPMNPQEFASVGTILVVDDSPVNQIIIREILTDIGCEVHIVSSAKEALQQLSIGDYDVIFMDIHMPEMTGLELTQHIRDSIHPAPYIIALTANAFDEMRRQSKAVGMNDYVTKPFLRDHIIEALRRIKR